MAALHAAAFAGQGRSWSAEEFAALLHSEHVFHTGNVQCFALGRVVADEADLLTIATDPGQRRAGLGRKTLCKFEVGVKKRGAMRVFLDVSEENRAAYALYLNTGYTEIARRKAYYQTPAGRRDAIIMEKRLI